MDSLLAKHSKLLRDETFEEGSDEDQNSARQGRESNRLLTSFKYSINNDAYQEVDDYQARKVTKNKHAIIKEDSFKSNKLAFFMKKKRYNL